jgi:hypothetical protein
MVDYHNTIEVKGQVSRGTMTALANVMALNVEVSICSWCGANRSQDVVQECRELEATLVKGFSLAKGFKRVHTFGQLGRLHKVTLAKEWRVVAIFDDNADICRTAAEVDDLRVFPIRTNHDKHLWTSKYREVEAFDTLEAALHHFMYLMRWGYFRQK